MLRGALAILLDRPAGTIELAIEPDGKPVLEQSDGWHFNLSHADGVLAFAIARCPVGIDVERSKPGRDVAGLMARYFTPIECSQFFALTEAKREASFLRGWTCKEALLKALGTGLRDLQRCAVDLDPDAPPLIVENVPGTGRWAAYTWDVEPGAAAAVALPFGD